MTDHFDPTLLRSQPRTIVSDKSVYAVTVDQRACGVNQPVFAPESKISCSLPNAAIFLQASNTVPLAAALACHGAGGDGDEHRQCDAGGSA
jgi:hypothetical protein